jgi:hypothetical protein
MRELLRIADRIEDLSREIPISSYAGFLEETNRKIRKIVSKEAFYIDVYKSEIISNESKRLSKILDDSLNETEFVFSNKNEKNFDTKVFEDIFPAIALVYLDEELLQSVDLKQYLKSNESPYKVILAVTLSDEIEPNPEFDKLFSYRVKVIHLSSADFVGKRFNEVLATHFEPVMLENLKNLSYLNSIEPLFPFLDEILLAENKAASTRKLLNNQNVNITRKEEQGANLSDLSGSLRQLIQKDIQDLEKNYKIKYDDFNKPNIGAFSINLKNEVDKLTDFEKQNVAEKSEKVDISIDTEFQKAFTNEIRSHLSKEYVKDESFVKSSFENLIKKVNVQLVSKGISAVNPADVYLPFPEGKRVLDSYCYIAREYKGELMKRGATEYFVALRDYTGIIMVAVGLLGPLNGITMMGDFFDKDKDKDGAASTLLAVFKGFNSTIKILTAVITLGMIIYGVLDLRKRIPRRRIEEFEREMAKAKDSLNQEGKRMYNDGSKDWLQNISAWIRDASQNLSFQIEKNLKNTQLSRVNQASQEKAQQQKQVQIIDVLLTSLQSAGKIKDQVASRYRDMVADAEKNLKF